MDDRLTLYATDALEDAKMVPIRFETERAVDNSDPVNASFGIR